MLCCESIGASGPRAGWPAEREAFPFDKLPTEGPLRVGFTFMFISALPVSCTGASGPGNGGPLSAGPFLQ